MEKSCEKEENEDLFLLDFLSHFLSSIFSSVQKKGRNREKEKKRNRERERKRRKSSVIGGKSESRTENNNNCNIFWLRKRNVFLSLPFFFLSLSFSSLFRIGSFHWIVQMCSFCYFLSLSLSLALFLFMKIEKERK